MKLEARDPEQNPFGYLLYQTRVRRAEKPGKPMPMAEAAIFLHVREGTFLQWETGKGGPSFDSGTRLLRRLAEFTGRGPVEILEILDIVGPDDPGVAAALAAEKGQRKHETLR